MRLGDRPDQRGDLFDLVILRLSLIGVLWDIELL